MAYSEELRKRALFEKNPDEVAKIMDEADPWDYPPMVLYELMIHLRATLFANLLKMFFNEELVFGEADVEKVDKAVEKLAANLDEKSNINPELPEDVKNMLTWLAALEGKMDIYEARLAPRIINRFMDYAGGFLSEVYINAFGMSWANCEDGDVKYVLKKGETEVGDPSVSVYNQLIKREDHAITETFKKQKARLLG